MVPAAARHWKTPAADGDGRSCVYLLQVLRVVPRSGETRECWHHSGREREGLETKLEELVHWALKMRLPSHWLAPHSLWSCSEEPPRAADSASHLLHTGHSGFPTQMDRKLGARTR